MLEHERVPASGGNKRRRSGRAACPTALGVFIAGCALTTSLLVSVGQPALAGALPVGKTYMSQPPVPAPGTCHARGVLPDRRCTPGALNPAVTPADMGSTICKAGWTETVRPPEPYTEALKARQMAAYGDTAPISKYEEDHLVSLELGGAPSDPRNLWPEYGASPNPKDRVENAARAAVCAHRLSLRSAQVAIATNWVALGETLGLGDLAGQVPVPSRPYTTSTVASSGGAEHVALWPLLQAGRVLPGSGPRPDHHRPLWHHDLRETGNRRPCPLGTRWLTCADNLRRPALGPSGPLTHDRIDAIEPTALQGDWLGAELFKNQTAKTERW